MPLHAERRLPLLEGLAGDCLCALGVVSGSWARGGFGLAGAGVATVRVRHCLCLLIGQRLAKDYAGAAVIATYFAVALIGLTAFLSATAIDQPRRLAQELFEVGLEAPLAAIRGDAHRLRRQLR